MEVYIFSRILYFPEEKLIELKTNLFLDGLKAQNARKDQDLKL